MKNGYLMVTEVSRLTGLTRKALRYYEETGLLRPAGRTEAGYRLYDEEALRRITLIRRAKALGLTLAETEAFIHVAEGCCDESHPELVALLRSKLADTDRDIENLRSLRASLASALERIETSEGQHRCEETLCTCNVPLAIGRKEAV